ncbi:hypothetical protein Ahy_A04g020467 [Arachis hypogaea]|uniref:fructose-bisphosphatase n=1 Tax=Arachis hypogaea TaxID=3818 RepID=A0A445DHY4_ARAHY|nr:hypothetical protein Ahy_A04g020467 [Arachis hypogaea]
MNLLSTYLLKGSIRKYTRFTCHLESEPSRCKYVCSAVNKGEEQKKLNVLSNKVFVNALISSGRAVKELEDAVFVKPKQYGKYIVVFYPLDGSSNIESGVFIGAIFGIYAAKDKDNVTLDDVLQLGNKMLAVGYYMYGSSCMVNQNTNLMNHSFWIWSDIITVLRSEGDKMELEAKFSKRRLDSFMKEFEHEKAEANSILARNVEFSQLTADYQRKLCESSESLNAAEELSRRLTMEHENEVLSNAEKRASDEERGVTSQAATITPVMNILVVPHSEAIRFR